MKCGCGFVLEDGHQRHLTQLPIVESIVVPTPQHSFMPLMQGFFSFFIDTETGFICEVHAGDAILCVCVCVRALSLSVCVYTYVIHMAIQVAVGISHFRGLFPKHWKALAMRHYIVIKLQNIFFMTVVSS